MIHTSPIAAVISDPRQADNPIVNCNEAFLALTGYSREEIIGRNCRFLAGPDTEPELSQMLRDGIAAAQPVMVELLNYRKDGSRFRNAVMVAPIFGKDGELEFFLGSQVEVAESDTLEADAKRREAREKIETLSDRQRQILVEMAAGKLNKQIAWELGLSERTVKMHRSAVIKGLDVRTSADAIRIAVEAGY
jgi:PAS domain S-box-containing protein